MVMRIGGLASGMDIDALVEKLMNAERAPLNKLTQKKQTYEWQRDAYRGVNTKLKTFDTYIADNLVLKTLNSKTASSSNSSLVSATATGTATGTISIDGVSQLAKAARGVSDRQINATDSTKLTDIEDWDSSVTSISLKAIQSNGQMASEATEIKFDSNTTVSQLISKINSSNAGVSAVFENGKLSITAKNTGENKTAGEGEVEVTAGASVFGVLGFDALKGQSTGTLASGGSNSRFSVNGIVTERSTNSFSINGYNLTLNSTFNEAATHSKFTDASNTNLTHTTKNLESLLSLLSTKYSAGLNPANEFSIQIEALKPILDQAVLDKEAVLNTDKAGLALTRDYLFHKDELNNLTAEAKDFVNSLNADQRKKLADIDVTTNDLTSLNLTSEQQNKFQALNETDKTALTELEASYFDKTAGSIYDSLSTKAKDLLNSYTAGSSLDDNTDLSTEEKTILTNLSEAELTSLRDVDTNSKQVNQATEALNLVKADATNLINTVNAFNTAQSTVDTAGASPSTTVSTDAVTMTSTTNVDEMMNKIKEFVTTYNGLIKGLNDQTKETKYRDYAPLTPEQKKDMDENEIKLWEEKAKSGLLRNDSVVRNGLSNMRSLIYQSNPGIEGSKYNTLFNIGITTSKSYNDGGTLEIDEAKLRKAIEEDPDAVERLFKNSGGQKSDPAYGGSDTRGYFEKLRESMKSLEVNIEKKAGRSTMTDAQYAIGKSLIDNEKRIDTWQNKLKNIEARYWKQFTAMETAINKANQQSSMFMQG
ncbi:flagellar filament capping protein FliD [Solibacillus sp. A46]|uniref:Flagellar hook-associated protein 2 n=1 Tax=Solibacillus faecavium TaxID=2762221 RepID=A0ABR8XUS6_9BACL|nr:flagellar filament capping protein FliD [Solibacillus faecavium]MBD8035698.1 flagellar filament capping protein FliD [Solibacillus faecavium]